VAGGSGPNFTASWINSVRVTFSWCGSSTSFRVSLRDVLTIMERLTEAKSGFRSLTEAIDTTTPAGRMMMQMVGAFAEFERAMLKERTKAGLDAARRTGALADAGQSYRLSIRPGSRRWFQRAKTAADAARLFKIHPATVSRLLARAYAK
jgi:DNA invertase Pin-like site-specific DNA recombinase